MNTVKDLKTGLIWPKLIQQNDMNLSDAKKYCTNLSLDGYKNWRLPTIKELISLTHPSVTHPSIINVVIPNPKYFTHKSKLTFSTLDFWSSDKVKEKDEYDSPYSRVSSFDYSFKAESTDKDYVKNNALCVFRTSKAVYLNKLAKISESTFDEEKAKREIDEMLKAVDASISY